jgi:hypothetical protein
VASRSKAFDEMLSFLSKAVAFFDLQFQWHLLSPLSDYENIITSSQTAVSRRAVGR